MNRTRLKQLGTVARQGFVAGVLHVAARVELRDCLFGSGFMIAWYGGYRISAPWSFVAAGFVLMISAVFLVNHPPEGQ